jgi:DNA-directed RNA polymerase specialized sigma24 family protein
MVQKAQAGDREAFGQLFGRHAETALRLAGQMVGEECAREMVQEGALQALLSLDRLAERASFGSWLCGIVLNLCRGQLRQRRRELSWEDLVGGACALRNS